MSRHRITIAALVAVAAVGGALACGPDFPWQLLDDRHATMTEPVAFGFSFDATRLVAPPQDRLRAAEQSRQRLHAAARARDHRDRAARGRVRRLANARHRSSGRGADRRIVPVAAAGRAGRRRRSGGVGRGRRPPVRRGQLHRGRRRVPAERYDQAASYFDAIDALPPEQRTIRQVAAAYMKGRIHQLQGEAAGSARRVPGRARRCRGRRPGPDGPRGRKLRRRGKGRPHRGGADHARALADRGRGRPGESIVPHHPCRAALCRAGRARIEDRLAVAAPGGVPAGRRCRPAGPGDRRSAGAAAARRLRRLARRAVGRGEQRGRQRERDRGGAEAAHPDGRRGDRPPGRARLPVRPLRRRRAVDREDRSAARPVGAGEARAASQRSGGRRARLDRGADGQPESRRCQRPR